MKNLFKTVRSLTLLFVIALVAACCLPAFNENLQAADNDLRVNVAYIIRSGDSLETVQEGSGGTHSTVPLGGTGAVKITYTNNGTNPIKDLTIYGIIPNTTNSTDLGGMPISSQWSATAYNLEYHYFNEFGFEDYAGASLQVSTAVNPKITEAAYGYNRNGSSPNYQWIDTPTMGTMKSWKFKYSGYLMFGESIEIVISVRTPVNGSIGQTAMNNTIAFGTYVNPMSGARVADVDYNATNRQQQFVISESAGGKISGYAFKDINMNGIKDMGEGYYANVPLELEGACPICPNRPSGVVLGRTVTDENGYYEFPGLESNGYFVRVRTQEMGSPEPKISPFMHYILHVDRNKFYNVAPEIWDALWRHTDKLELATNQHIANVTVGLEWKNPTSAPPIICNDSKVEQLGGDGITYTYTKLLPVDGRFTATLNFKVYSDIGIKTINIFFIDEFNNKVTPYSKTVNTAPGVISPRSVTITDLNAVNNSWFKLPRRFFVELIDNNGVKNKLWTTTSSEYFKDVAIDFDLDDVLVQKSFDNKTETPGTVKPGDKVSPYLVIEAKPNMDIYRPQGCKVIDFAIIVRKVQNADGTPSSTIFHDYTVSNYVTKLDGVTLAASAAKIVDGRYTVFGDIKINSKLEVGFDVLLDQTKIALGEVYEITFDAEGESKFYHLVNSSFDEERKIKVTVSEKTIAPPIICNDEKEELPGDTGIEVTPYKVVPSDDDDKAYGNQLDFKVYSEIGVEKIIIFYIDEGGNPVEVLTETLVVPEEPNKVVDVTIYLEDEPGVEESMFKEPKTYLIVLEDTDETPNAGATKDGDDYTDSDYWVDLVNDGEEEIPPPILCDDSLTEQLEDDGIEATLYKVSSPSVDGRYGYYLDFKVFSPIGVSVVDIFYIDGVSGLKIPVAHETLDASSQATDAATDVSIAIQDETALNISMFKENRKYYVVLKDSDNTKNASATDDSSGYWIDLIVELKLDDVLDQVKFENQTPAASTVVPGGTFNGTMTLKTKTSDGFKRDIYAVTGEPTLELELIAKKGSTPINYFTFNGIKVYVNDTLQTEGTDYTIDSKTIKFKKDIVEDSVIKVDFSVRTVGSMMAVGETYVITYQSAAESKFYHFNPDSLDSEWAFEVHVVALPSIT